MTVGILYIALGRYDCFWEGFYKSSERYLLPGVEKHYYVITDSNKIQDDEKTTVVPQGDLGWPLDALFRYKFILKTKQLISHHDYLYFFNGNTLFKETVTAEEILPVDEDLAVLCWVDGQTGKEMHHESRPESASYVAKGEARYYFASGLFGGRTKAYLELLEECDKIADADLMRCIMPQWHDESVINKYLLNKHVRVLSQVYGRPEQWRKPSNAKIVFRKKEKVLGRNWLRNYKQREHTNTLLRRFLRTLGLVK